MTDEGPLQLLVVDDDATDVSLIRDQLSMSGRTPPFRIDAVGSLQEALKRVARKDVDVVLLDLGLPDAIGVTAVERLCLEAPATPVVVLTGLEDEETGLSAVQRGAQDYLVKGRVDGALIDRSLRFAVERKRAEHALARLASVMAGLCYECGRKLAGNVPPATAGN
jgi:two-component system, cell cycle sensor histidine kinase and response regulator CckA